ncbi:hypothetical protein IQ269_22620, partial [Tychonema sp. LEGE 07199]|uniref:hypothetical protein n=1 Tax=Tychonema sp. LEGE 07199 TaxID=1828668 RepID=UPI0019EA23BC|nr:hypothetical protein [Tychonema sp. LEGE 07199]
MALAVCGRQAKPRNFLQSSFVEKVEGRGKKSEGRSPREEVRGKKSEGSSATSNVPDVTDVTDVSPSEEVRGKKEYFPHLRLCDSPTLPLSPPLRLSPTLPLSPSP